MLTVSAIQPNYYNVQRLINYAHLDPRHKLAYNIRGARVVKSLTPMSCLSCTNLTHTSYRNGECFGVAICDKCLRQIREINKVRDNNHYLYYRTESKIHLFCGLVMRISNDSMPYFRLSSARIRDCCTYRAAIVAIHPDLLHKILTYWFITEIELLLQ